MRNKRNEPQNTEVFVAFETFCVGSADANTSMRQRNVSGGTRFEVESEEYANSEKGLPKKMLVKEDQNAYRDVSLALRANEYLGRYAF